MNQRLKQTFVRLPLTLLPGLSSTLPTGGCLISVKALLHSTSQEDMTICQSRSDIDIVRRFIGNKDEKLEFEFS